MNQINLIDKCKRCGCLTLECQYCIDNRFYRHIDDKIKMKNNLKIIRIHKSGFLYYIKFFFRGKHK